MTLKNNKCVEILSHGKGQPRGLCGPQMGSASLRPPTPRAPAPRPNPVPRSSGPGRRLAGRDRSRPQDKPSATTGRKALATPPTGPAPAHCRPSRSPRCAQTHYLRLRGLRRARGGDAGVTSCAARRVRAHASLGNVEFRGVRSQPQAAGEGGALGVAADGGA